MNNAEKFALCLRLAQKTVRQYREEAPTGYDPQNSGIAIAGLVVSAAGTAYGAYSKNKEAKAAAGAGAGLPVGKKPNAAEYKPVNFTKEQGKAIRGNINNIGNISTLTNLSDRIITREALNRARTMIPNYDANLKLEGMATNSLLQGQLPYDDVLDIVAKRGEAGNAIGTPGGSAPATMRDLGLSRLDAIKTGSGLMKGMVDIAEQINPVGRQMLPQSMYINPMERIQMAMQQNQLIQQSDQNRNNIEAAPSPSEALRAQVGLGGQLQGGGGGGGAGYAQALSGLLSGLAQYKGSGSGGGTVYPEYNVTGAAARTNAGWRTNAMGGTSIAV